MNPPRHRQLLYALALFVALLQGCSQPSPQELVAAAQVSIDKGEAKTAVVQLKQALQQDPDRADARFLLGSVLVRLGSPGAAQIELRKALELAHPEAELVPMLAAAMLASGQANQVLVEWGDKRIGQARPDALLQSTLASAHLQLGQPRQASERIDLALRLSPNLEPAQLTRAQMTASAGEAAAALQAVESIIARNPKNVAALQFRGDLEQAAFGRFDDSLVSYRRALEVDPGYDPAQVAIVTTLLRQGKLEAAQGQLKTLLDVSPNNPSARYLEALLAYQRLDFKRTKELTQRILRSLPNSSRVLLLAAAAEAELGSLNRAEELLARSIQSEPGLLSSYRLLITIHLRSGNHARALEVLNSLAERNLLTEDMLSLAGQVYLFNGEAARAQSLFERALTKDPQDTRKQTALAIARLAGGQPAAFDELRSIADRAKGPEADLALIAAHMRHQNFDEALAALERLEAKPHDKVNAAQLKGQVLLAMGRRADARKSFEAALKHNPRYFAAIASLATLDVSEGDMASARQRFERLLVSDPGSAQAWMSLARLEMLKHGDLRQAVAHLRKAIEAQPTDPAPKLMLIETLIAAKDLKEALSVAQGAVAALPNHYGLLDALGGVQQLMGTPEQAITTYGKLIPIRPGSPRPYLRLAEANLANQNKATAIKQLRKALEVQPDSIEAQRGLILLAIDAGDYREAMRIAREIQQQRPKDAAGYLLAGDIARTQGDAKAMQEAYRLGVESTASAELAARWHVSLVEADKSREAELFVQRWTTSHPSQVDFLVYLGDWALSRKDLPGAEAFYGRAVDAQPDHAVARNNLAWVMAQSGKSGALAHAQRATKLAPLAPTLWDTLAAAHTARGEHALAAVALRRAIDLAPTNVDKLRLALARALLAAGDRVAAKEELQRLARLGPKFDDQAEVVALLAKL